MKDTLLMMKGIINGKEIKGTNEELACKYKETISSDILAYMYVSNFGIISQIADKYTQIDDTDKASFCLQILDTTLRKFNKEKNIKFITFFCTAYNNKLISELNHLYTNKQLVNINTEELDYNTFNYMEDSIETEDEILNNWNLSTKEKLHCKLLVKGYSVKELANIFNTSIWNNYKRLSKIRKKIIEYNTNFEKNLV